MFCHIAENPSPLMPYHNIPNELILQIATVGLDDPCDLNSFIQTEKRTHTLLQPLLKSQHKNSLYCTDSGYSLGELGDILITACLNGWERLARLALEKGAPVWRLANTAMRNSPRWPEPFVAAVLAGSQKLVELLLQYGARQKGAFELEYFGSMHYFASSPMRTAASRGFVVVMLWIVKEHQVHQNPVQDYPELLGVLEKLLQCGAEPNFYAGQALFPLLAVAAQSHEILELILKYGGRLNSQSPTIIRGGSVADGPLHVCMSCEKCPSRFAHANDNESHRKCTPWVNLKSMEVLLKAGVCLNSTNFAGETALHVAASFGLLEAVELLLRNGADVHIKDWRRCSARERALKKGYRAVVQLLERFEKGDSGGGE
jgi:hypothetical protein